jgi:hypothetical protein
VSTPRHGAEKEDKGGGVELPGLGRSSRAHGKDRNDRRNGPKGKPQAREAQGSHRYLRHELAPQGYRLSHRTDREPPGQPGDTRATGAIRSIHADLDVGT